MEVTAEMQARVDGVLCAVQLRGHVELDGRELRVVGDVVATTLPANAERDTGLCFKGLPCEPINLGMQDDRRARHVLVEQYKRTVRLEEKGVQDALRGLVRASHLVVLHPERFVLQETVGGPWVLDTLFKKPVSPVFPTFGAAETERQRLVRLLPDVVVSGDLSWGAKDSWLADTALWGARCIWKAGQAPDVVWDRQGFVGGKDDVHKLMAALNGKQGSRNCGALTAFLRAVSKGRLEVPESIPLGRAPQYVSKGVQFQFTDNASNGYLYVTARLAPSK